MRLLIRIILVTIIMMNGLLSEPVTIMTLDKGGLEFDISNGFQVKLTKPENVFYKGIRFHLPTVELLYKLETISPAILSVELIHYNKWDNLSFTAEETEVEKFLEALYGNWKFLTPKTNGEYYFGTLGDRRLPRTGQSAAVRNYLRLETDFVLCDQKLSTKGSLRESNRKFPDLSADSEQGTGTEGKMRESCDQPAEARLQILIQGFNSCTKSLRMEPVYAALLDRLTELSKVVGSDTIKLVISAKIDKLRDHEKLTNVETKDVGKVVNGEIKTIFSMETFERKNSQKTVNFGFDQDLNSLTVKFPDEPVQFYECLEPRPTLSKYLYNEDNSQGTTAIHTFDLFSSNCEKKVARIAFSDLDGYLSFINQYKDFTFLPRRTKIELISAGSGTRTSPVTINEVKGFLDRLFGDFVAYEGEFYLSLKALIFCELFKVEVEYCKCTRRSLKNR
jgi:hypothetical protein